MKRLGELLQQARLAKNLTLEEISGRTKIQHRYLEALERGDISPFAAEIYFKGALRNYAEMIDLNAQEVLDYYYRLKADSAQSENGTAKQEEIEKAGKAAQRLWQRVRPAGRTRPAQSRTTLSHKVPSYRAGLILLSLLLLAVVVYGATTNFWGRITPPVPPENIIQPGEQEHPPDDPVEPAPPKPEPKVICSGTADNETAYTVSGLEQVEVTVHLRGRCWVRILTDGRETFQETCENGREIVVNGADTVWIRLGYPPVARIQVNGTEIAGLKELVSPHNFIFTLQ